MPSTESLCLHERTIGALQASHEALKGSLDKIERAQQETVRILEKIAMHETRVDKLESDQEEVFQRLRKVELDTNSLSVKIGLYAAGIGAFIAAVISAFVKHYT